MSSHADTVRRYIKAEYPPQPASQAANNAEDAVDAMEAESQQLRDALKRIDTSAPLPREHYDSAEWWKHIASKRREIAQAALAAVRVEER
jgi:hypothetical protein